MPTLDTLQFESKPEPLFVRIGLDPAADEELAYAVDDDGFLTLDGENRERVAGQSLSAMRTSWFSIHCAISESMT